MLAEQKAAKEWQPDQVRFMRWLAMSKKARVPKTQQQFAKEIGVHETTLSDWKRIDGFMAEVKLISVSLVDDEVPEVIAKIVSQAKQGSFAHQQMVLEMAEVLKPKEREPLGEVVLRVKYDGP